MTTITKPTQHNFGLGHILPSHQLTLAQGLGDRHGHIT